MAHPPYMPIFWGGRIWHAFGFLKPVDSETPNPTPLVRIRISAKAAPNLQTEKYFRILI